MFIFLRQRNGEEGDGCVVKLLKVEGAAAVVLPVEAVEKRGGGKEEGG